MEDMKKIKALNFRWTVLLVSLGVICGFIGGYNTHEAKRLSKSVTLEEKTNKDGNAVYTVSSKNLNIEFVQVSDDMEDILITPKNGHNVTPEFDLYASEHYKDAYLVALSKDKAKQIRETQKEFFPDYKFTPFTWNE